MEINLKEIVGQVIDKMEKENTIETIIETELKNTIEKAIKDSIGGYKTRNQISDKLEKEVSSVLKNLDMKSFNSYIVKSINEVLVDDTKKDLKDKIDQELKLSLNLVELPDVMKLSDLLTRVQEFFDESLSYEDKESEDFELNISLKERESKSIFSTTGDDDLELNIGTSEDVIKLNLWHIRSNEENVFTILGLYLNDVSINTALKEKRRLSEIEILFAKMHLQGVKIEIDVEDFDEYNYLSNPNDI